MADKKIKIVIDTSAGIYKKECEEEGYELIGLPFILDDIEYNDLTISESEFFDKLETSSKIHTSQATIESVIGELKNVLKTCDEVLYFPITSGLSSSYNTGMLIAESDEFKGKVFCVDHRTISVPERRLLLDVKKMIEAGMDAMAIKRKVESESKNDIWIVVDNFNYLKKGGRVDAVTATIGNILNIKPILYSNGGKFSAVKKERSIKNAFDSMLDFVDKVIDSDNSKFGNEYVLDVAYTKNIDLAREMKQKMHDRFNIPLDNIYIGMLPQVVACHTGPNTIGAALYKNIKI